MRLLVKLTTLFAVFAVLPRCILAEARETPIFPYQLTPADTGLPRTGLYRNGFDLYDINGDGRLDVLHGPPRKAAGPPEIYLNQGSGIWQRWTAEFPDIKYDYGDIVGGDFNADGKADLALGMHHTGIAVLLGDGSGKFSAVSIALAGKSYQSILPFPSRAIERIREPSGERIVALSEASIQMIGATQPKSTLLKIPGIINIEHQAGSFNARYLLEGRELIGDTLAVADINRDGQAELIFAPAIQSSPILMARKNAQVEVALGKIDRSPTPTRFVDLSALPSAFGVALVGYTAIENDANGWRSEVGVILVSQDGSVTHAAPPAQLPAGAHALGWGDIDHNGAPDLLVADGRTELVWYEYQSSGELRLRQKLPLPTDLHYCTAYRLRIAELSSAQEVAVVINFGEPTDLLDTQAAPKAACPNGGGIRSWTIAPLARNP